MPHACLTAAAPADQAAFLPPPPPTAKRCGNPNRHLAPARLARGPDPRSARTRSGGPCRSPAIHGKLRCPAGQARGQAPHGGRSPGPRTPEGLPRPRPGAASGCATPAPSMATTASTRADNRHRVTRLRIIRHARTPHWPSFEYSRWPGFTCRLRPRNPAPTIKTGSTAPFKPFRTDPLNREPGAFPGPDPRPVHRVHEPAHVRASTPCTAHADPAPQAR